MESQIQRLNGLTAQEIIALNQDVKAFEAKEGHGRIQRGPTRVIEIDGKTAFYDTYDNGSLFQFFYFNKEGQKEGKFLQYNLNGEIDKSLIFSKGEERPWTKKVKK
jgi:hypothetical protein